MNSRIKVCFSLFISIIALNYLYAQTTNLSGTVKNENGEPVTGAIITVVNTNSMVVTQNNGSFTISVPLYKEIVISCSFLGSSTLDTIVTKTDENIYRNYIINENTHEIKEVIVEGIKDHEYTLRRVNPKSFNQLPGSSENFETILKAFPGVVSGNELSSQYSVRGGNFDENLVYVNDIEIYRPMLIQSAQQEGLSFVNSNMVSTVQFSAGGFEAEYGDKMSSVLDITYKKHTDFDAGASMSLLGAKVHAAGMAKNQKLSYNTGLRYKTSQYMLSSLDVKGEYTPRIADFQSYITYEIDKKNSISFLGNVSANRYNMIPETRSTIFGYIAQTLNFDVYYEGQERDKFDTYLGALSYTYTPSSSVLLKFIASSFYSDEEIAYDILSEYYINVVNKGSGRDTVINIGTGADLKHARKYLNARIHSIEHKGTYRNNYSTLKWGIKGQYEQIDDRFREWRVIDSTGYFVPDTKDDIKMEYLINGENNIASFRYQSFIQNSNRIYAKSAEVEINYGMRANYWNVNHELLVSPRISLMIKPYWEKDIEFFFATGLYGQPPFYKELKDYTGKLYLNTKAQKSFHLVAGSDIHYMAWNRPFTFSTELYYKNMYNIIPYRISNIQIQYMPNLKARGYAIGADFRIYGEFVPGIESWFSLSLMQTKEDTYNDNYSKIDKTVVYPGYYRRLTDQLVTFSIFFQDYLPSNPDYKLHLLLNFGSGLPYSGPHQNRPSGVYEMNQYKRVDIGFSRIIRRTKSTKIGLNDIWISFEILNLLDSENMASYDYVHTVTNNEGYSDYFAVPNLLTGRRFNVKISTKL